MAEFTIEQAHTLEEIAVAAEQDRLDDLLIHPRRVLPHIPSVTATKKMSAKFVTGAP